MSVSTAVVERASPSSCGDLRGDETRVRPLLTSPTFAIASQNPTMTRHNVSERCDLCVPVVPADAVRDEGSVSAGGRVRWGPCTEKAAAGGPVAGSRGLDSGDHSTAPSVLPKGHRNVHPLRRRPGLGRPGTQQPAPRTTSVQKPIELIGELLLR